MATRSETFLFWQKYLGHPFQAVLVWLIMGFVRFFPVDIASGMGGWIGRKLGPKSKPHKRAKSNLQKAFPQKSDNEINQILDDMWDNLGRTVFEFPHMQNMDTVSDTKHFTVVGGERVKEHMASGKTGMFWGGHLGNWEFLPKSVAQWGAPLTVVARMPDNPWVTKIFYKRTGSEDLNVQPKGRLGAKAAMETLRGGGHVGMLVDQKMNDGIAVPFFGRDAMTAPALAQLAIKYNSTLYPCQLERLGRACKFKITIHPPMTFEGTGNRKEDALALMTLVNAQLEDWIRQNPGQWLWAHKRWPD